MTKLAVVTPQSEQSPARRKLADAIAAKATADALFGEAAAAVTAASSLITQEDVARRQLDGMNQRNAESVTEWANSGGKGKPDIADPVIVATLQHDMTIATANATESARTGSVATRHDVDTALVAVLEDEATATDAEIAALFDRVTVLRARLWGLGNHVQARMPRSYVLGNIRRILERVLAAEPTSAAVNAEQDRWRALADKLTTDPTATIQPE
jgi:hypothetical protein